jgi:uncharacterized protein (TIGR02996 family)
MIDLLKEPLFAEVLAHPDDDAPRLVLADRLMEAGDPRGEFIRLQCMVEQETDDAKTRDLKARAQKILKKNQPAWLKPFKPFVRSTLFRRGFVDYYLAEPPLVFKGIATVVQHTPVRGLRIQSMKRGDAAKLGNVAELRRLSHLDVSSGRINTEDATVLFASPHLASLRTLDASRNFFGDEGVQVLARAAHLSKLARLGLSHVQMGMKGVAAIATASFIRNLESLSMDGAAIDPEAFAPLASAPLVSLRRLMIWNCKIGDAGARALAESPHLGKLEELRAVNCDIGVAGMLAIARSKTLSALRWFEPFAGDGPKEVMAELHARFPHVG